MLRLVHQEGPTTRASITERLGLARNTVGVLLDALVTAGLLAERSPALAGTRGRPSPIIDTVPARAGVLAVDLAVDAVRLAVVGLGGRVLSRKEWAHDPEGSAEAGVATLVEVLRDLARRRRRAGAAFQAVGVACWGIVRGYDGFVYNAPNIGWRDVALGAALADGLSARAGGRPLVQAISVANDADLGAIAEFRRGAGAGARRLLYVHSNVGVGGGIIDQGHLLAAAGGYVGEIGHMTVNPQGIRCHCGATGCWETEVDERALLRAAGVGAELEGKAAKDAVARVLADAAARERTASAAVRRIAASLGAGLASLVHILGPDRIVLGGYLADLLALAPSTIRGPLRERGFSPEARDIVIRPAACGEDAAILGAAEHAFETLFADPLAVVA
ncbi:ROK family transcriptional regulator [Acrocarpospora macrocephala]|uniref:Sugar kinase n=1 Tax=Acrocarpospora macrocephala TaxID=150177 RepID=A0A5M3X1B4_9ACTN|nr:sugar kinase [Acrocarpospora macrocephala]